jgi:hypothetical protein
MTQAEVISSLIAFLALVVSVITAYRTLLAKPQVDVFVKPRVILNRYNKIPSLVVGCEISNRGAQPSTIDDIVLYVKYREHNSDQGTKGISTHLLLPALTRESYSVFITYKDTDFEPFLSIPIPINTRLTKFIVFSPSNDNGFSPLEGELELQLFSRNAGEKKWRKASTELRVPINANSATTWKDPNGNGIQIDTLDHNRLREKLMNGLLGNR